MLGLVSVQCGSVVCRLLDSTGMYLVPNDFSNVGVVYNR